MLTFRLLRSTPDTGPRGEKGTAGLRRGEVSASAWVFRRDEPGGLRAASSVLSTCGVLPS